MGRGKDKFIEQTGGFRIGESPAEFSDRVSRIDELERRLRSGEFRDAEVETALMELRSLKGLPDPEWDYEPPDD